MVVDDSSAVWPSHERNLLKVERYIYFPSSRRQFGLRGKSLLELGRSSAPPSTLQRNAMCFLRCLHGTLTSDILNIGVC